MLRKSGLSRFFFLRRSLTCLALPPPSSLPTPSSGESEFPDRADWLDGGGGSGSNNELATRSGELARRSSTDDDELAKHSGDNTSAVAYEPPITGVPVGIRHTNTQSLMKIAKQNQNLESFSAVKSDVAARATRAISAHARREDHFLLADLDPDLDTVLFGTDPEEFEQNVKRMKIIVSTYTKWERWDNFYMYSTRFLQFCCMCFAFLWWEAACEKHLLQTAAEDYAAQHENILKEVSDTRSHAIEYLIEDLKRSPPQIFPPKLVKNSDGDVVEDIQRHPMDTRPDAVWEAERQKKLLERAAQIAAAASDTEFLKRARRLMLPMSDDWTSVVREEMADFQKHSMESMRFPRLREFVDDEEQQQQQQQSGSVVVE